MKLISRAKTKRNVDQWKAMSKRLGTRLTLQSCRKKEWHLNGILFKDDRPVYHGVFVDPAIVFNFTKFNEVFEEQNGLTIFV
jgi:hypothetical protein